MVKFDNFDPKNKHELNFLKLLNFSGLNKVLQREFKNFTCFFFLFFLLSLFG